MSAIKKRVIFWTWFAIGLVLWVYTYRLIGSIILFAGWLIHIKDYPLKKKIGKSILAGLFLFLLFIVSEFRRYELQTTFYQPCWSPDGKQIAFFMVRDVTRYRPGMLGDIPTLIWKKNYLSTMDYDGGNFRMVKETENMGRVLWPGSGNIVYSEEKHGGTVINGKVNNTVDGVAYKIDPDGARLEKLWQWNEKTKYQGVEWLTPKEDYLVLSIYNDKTQGFAFYDRKEKMVMKEIFFPLNKNIFFYGSYKNNNIAINEGNHLTILDLDTLKTQNIDWKENDALEKLLVGYDLGAISPDRSMDADDVFRSYNKKYGIERTKRSYLFNIFGK